RAKNRAFRCNSSAPAGLAGFPLQSLAPHGLIADLNLLTVLVYSKFPAFAREVGIKSAWSKTHGRAACGFAYSSA
ncbi:MAG: hypothetical protein LBT33_03100, partial [Spirochaetia bacterium]|nr:hypothetical protein [Spirochaetia bacterium]